MKNTPDFLPPILELTGSWEEILTVLYDIFERDFKQRPVQHKGIRVYHDGRILPDGLGKEEGFWHVVSKKDRRSGERLIDYRRAERLPWARPMIESNERPEITVFDYVEGPKDKGARTYILLQDYDYVVILQRRKKAYYWITAHHVDSDWKRKDLRRRQSNGV